MVKSVLPNIDMIKAICIDNNVKELYLFGSALTNKFSDKSDIDFLVDFNSMTPLEYTDKYFKLKFSLEEILNREIDLLEKKTLKNPFLSLEIDKHKQLIYAA